MAISEELTHETVIKLIEKIDRYRMIPGAKFSSWLYRIAYNTYVDYVRKKPPVVAELDEVIDIAHTDEDLQETVIKTGYRPVEQDARYNACRDEKHDNTKVL